jgi:hypothetical protein
MRTVDTGAIKARAQEDRTSGWPLQQQSPAAGRSISLDWRVCEFANPDVLLGFLYANLHLRPDIHIVIWDEPGLRGATLAHFLTGQLRLPVVRLDKRLDGTLETPRSFLHLGDGRLGVTLAEWCNRYARYVILPTPSYETFNWEEARAFRPDLFTSMDQDGYHRFISELMEDISGLCWRRIILRVNLFTL